jgi:hypothetical protein
MTIGGMSFHLLLRIVPAMRDLRHGAGPESSQRGLS